MAAPQRIQTGASNVTVNLSSTVTLFTVPANTCLYIFFLQVIPSGALTSGIQILVDGNIIGNINGTVAPFTVSFSSPVVAASTVQVKNLDGVNNRNISWSLVGDNI